MLGDNKDARVRQADIKVRPRGATAPCRRRWGSSPGQAWVGLLHQGKLEQGEHEGAAWPGAEGGPQGRGGKHT